jgi:transcriptional regulatory protein LevR
MKEMQVVTEWTPRVIEVSAKYPIYVKVAKVVEDVEALYPEFKKYNMSFKRSLVGKCLTGQGLVKNSKCNQGYIYRRIT